MEIYEIALIGFGATIAVAIGAFVVVKILNRIDPLKYIGGNKMQPKPMRKQLEEIQEPNDEDIELADEETEPEQEQNEPQKTICMIQVVGGKAFRGEFLGEDPQFVTLPGGKLVKQDSNWIKMRTEKTPLLVINKNHIVLMAFESLPEIKVPKKQQVPKQAEETDAEDAIQAIEI
jgi:hypothetical protein